MIPRIAVVGGIWQALMADAAVRQHMETGGGPPAPGVLVYHSRSPNPDTVRLLKQLLTADSFWLKVVDLSPILRFEALRSTDQINDVLTRVRETLGVETATELWISSLENWPDGCILAALPRANTYLYEDGLVTYFPAGEKAPVAGPNWRPQAWMARARMLASRLRRATQLPNAGLAREMSRLGSIHPEAIRDGYFLIGEALGRSPLPLGQTRKVSLKNARNTLERAYSAFGLEKVLALNASAWSHSVVFLAQIFAEGGFMTRDDELRIYREAVRTILAAGWQVVWKDHPKSRQPFAPDLQAQFGSGVDRFPEALAPWPMELVCLSQPPIMCVGITTSSLFYLPTLFEIPTFQCADQVADSLPSNYGIMATAVAVAIPSVVGIGKGKTIPLRATA